MDIPELVAEHEMAFEPQRQPEEQPEEYKEEQLEEDEECITLRRSDLLHFQDTLVDIRSQIRDVRFHFADLQRDVRQEQARGPGDVPSHHGQTASNSRTSCTTTSPVTSL
jgi:hypothetical protein